MPRSHHILPDMVTSGQKLWFVGTAAGPASAAQRAYYAHPGNRFWRTLHEVGVTPARIEPKDFRLLAGLGVGLTDFCKTGWGVDSAIAPELFDVPGFQKKVARLRPQGLAFTSKMAASLWLGRKTGRISIGRQAEEPDAGAPAVFVLPSPSGLATSYWSIEPWRELATWLRET